MTKVANFIGGELVDSVTGASMPLVDPSTGEEYATAPISNEQDIDNALLDLKAAAQQVEVGKVGLDFKVLKEFGARNRAQGSSVWAKAVVPF